MLPVRSDTQIAKMLTVAEVRRIAVLFVDAYDDGWRPKIYNDSNLQELYDKCVNVLYSRVE